jgi:hypothetical protein
VGGGKGDILYSPCQENLIGGLQVNTEELSMNIKNSLIDGGKTHETFFEQ